MANGPREDYHMGHQTRAGKPVWARGEGGGGGGRHAFRHTKPYPGATSPHVMRIADQSQQTSCQACFRTGATYCLAGPWRTLVN